MRLPKDRILHIDTDKEWIKEKVKEWAFGLLVGLGFFGLYVVACLSNGGVI